MLLLVEVLEKGIDSMDHHYSDTQWAAEHWHFTNIIYIGMISFSNQNEFLYRQFNMNDNSNF